MHNNITKTLNKVQEQVQTKFLHNQKIQHDLKALEANGLKFQYVGAEVITFAENEYTVEVKLNMPQLTKNLLTRKKIINTPKVSLDKNMLVFEEDIEIGEKPSRRFLSKLHDEFSTEELNDTINADNLTDKFEQKQLQIELEIMFNAQLESLSEDIKVFENEMLEFMEQFFANLGASGNRNALSRVIKQFKNSSIKTNTNDIFQYIYKTSIIQKKEELKKYQSAQWKLRQNIKNIFSIPTLLRQLTLIRQKISIVKMQTQHLKSKMNQVYNEIEHLVEEAFIDLILEEQSYSQSKSITQKIKISKFELYKYCLPRFYELLKMYQIDRNMLQL